MIRAGTLASIFCCLLLATAGAKGDVISITDTVTAADLGSPAGVTVSAGSVLTVTHDLTDQVAPPLDVVDADLTISIADESGGLAIFKLEGELHGGVLGFNGVFVSYEVGGASLDLNGGDVALTNIEGYLKDGYLHLEMIPAIGQFTFLQSTVRADIRVSVPEPATMALLGCGLGFVGLSGLRRRRRAARSA